MTVVPPWRSGANAVRDALDSPAFASAFTLTTLGAVLGGFALQRMMGLVAYVTIIVGLCIIGAAVLVIRRRELRGPELAPLALIALLAWVLVSAVWSRDPADTLRGWVTLTALAFLAMVIAQIRDTLQTARALGDVMRVLLTASLLVEILFGILVDMPFPLLGVQGNIAALGPVQGVFGTRNSLGLIAVIALITFLIEYRTQSVAPGVSLYSALLAGVLAVLSDSPTVLVLAVVVGVATAALALVRRVDPRRRARVQWTFGIVAVIGLLAAYLLRHRIIALLDAGRDFDTRADLWSWVLVYSRQQDVLGWGWTGRWMPDQFPYMAINAITGARHDSALSAYFDVLLQLGAVGLILFGAFVATAFVRSWLTAGERRSTVHAWTPLVLVALLTNSVFESFTLHGYGWLLLVLCALRAGRSRSWRERVGGRGAASDLPAA